MSMLYKIYDEQGIVRIFNNKDEAAGFLLLDKSFRIQTVKVQRVQIATNKFTWAYKILGDALI